MRVIIQPDYEQASRWVANYIAARILAFRPTAKKPFVLGLPTLYLFNVLRIVFLTLVGVYYHDLFDFMHLYFWQATLILMITTVWVMWILLVVSREKKTAAFLA